MRKTSLFASLVCVLIAACALAVGGDMGVATEPLTDGSETYPYLIEDLADFDTFADPNKAAIYWAAGVHTKLTTDIDLTGRTYTTAIIAPDTSSSSGFQGTAFSGSFSGNWHTIYGLKITGDSSYSGLFGKIQSGIPNTIVIKSVYLTNPFISAIDEVGSLAGCLNGGIVRDCLVYNGTVIARYKGGGLIGFNESGLIENACFMGSVALPDLSGGHDIGGLIGRNNDQVNQCFAIADLNVLFDAGGLVGWNEGVLSNCYSQGTLSGFRYIGGLIGVDSSAEVLLPAIQNCYTSTVIDTSSFSSFLAGAFIGVKHLSTFENCFWNITVNPELTGIGDDLNDPNIIGLSTQQMKQQANFTNWDFSDGDGDPADWRMLREGEDYPRLAWQEVFAGDIAGLYGADMVDFAYLANYWGLDDCDGLDDCGRADIDTSGDVGLPDLAAVVGDWLR